MESLFELLERSARRVPDRVAAVLRVGVTYRRYRYADLLRRAEQYAAALHSLGVRPEDRVLIWGRNEPEWVAAMFGAFRLGAVLVPLDVRCTEEFAELVLQRTEPKAGLVEAPFGSRFDRWELPWLELGKLPWSAPKLADEHPRPTRSALAEVVFTSGTTGAPKGVMLTHGNILSDLEAGLKAFEISEWTRMLSLLPLSHMFEQVAGCFAPLRVGASVCYPGSLRPTHLRLVMEEWRPTVLVAVPQLLALLYEAIEREAGRGLRGPAFRAALALAERLDERRRRALFRPVLRRLGGALDFVASGGAPLDPALQQAWERLGVPVVQGYGATECAPIVTITPRHDRRPGSVGKPLPGVQVRIDEDGEVLVRGPNVFAGYWRDEAATAAAFRDGWYATGDLGELRDGHLYLKGRKKDLIVLADGQNVYPEDVERVLTAQPGVKDAVVVGVERNGRTVVHAVILEAVRGAAGEAVRAANRRLDARQQILEYSVWPEEDFPRTHTMKVKRDAILAFAQSRERQAAPPAATPARGTALLEEQVRRIVAQTSARGHDVRDTDTLADLGLDSLGRVALLAAVEEETGVSIDDAEVGPQSTVAELVQLVATASRRGGRTPEMPSWPRSRPVRLLRRYLLKGAVFPLLRLGYGLEVRGRENFSLIQEPALVISNHNMHLDQGMLLRAMPDEFRDRLAIAAAASDIFGNRIRGFGSALLGNAFPFAKEGTGVRESLEFVAHLLAEGWHVLIFPEGKLTVGGPMQPFKSGIGLLAVETGAPVLPMRIDILRPGFWEGRWLPHPRARVRVNVGRPRRFPPDTSYAEATKELERAVREA